MTARSTLLGVTLASAAAALMACGDSGSSTAPPTGGDFASRGGNGVCLGDDGKPLPTAPRSARVDLVKPKFSNPTDITNPLFPVSRQARMLLFGNVEGAPLRIEVTLLPQTRIFRERRRRTETLISQFVAFTDGRIHEVAVDHYAQADDGAVWYFGEFVFNYEDGRVADTEGTWFAGEDGPSAMIMPANPKVGDVWRPENICGLVFEEVTAKTLGLTVNGPTGPVSGAILVSELHMDGLLEDKTFAPGYGEFFNASASGDVEALALGIPTDALATPTPAELQSLSDGADQIFDNAQVGNWAAASAALQSMNSAWSAFRAGNVPPMLMEQMDQTLAALATAVGAQQRLESRQASIDVARASLDLQLRHRPVPEIDLALLDLWGRQILVDIAAGDRSAVLGDVATLKWIRDRLADDVGREDDDVDDDLVALRTAATAADLAAASAASAKLRAAVSRLRNP